MNPSRASNSGRDWRALNRQPRTSQRVPRRNGCGAAAFVILVSFPGAIVALGSIIWRHL